MEEKKMEDYDAGIQLLRSMNVGGS